MRKGTYIDLTGMRFSRLVVKEYIGTKNRQVTWLCICDCGNETKVITERLRGNVTRSCGCLHKDSIRNISKYKGLSQTRVGRIWYTMINRCYKESSISYKNYGERGIGVCERWRESLENFIQDMGDPPSKDYSLDRIDVNKDYSPDNCKWSTRFEQSINTRVKSTNTSGHKGVSFSKSNQKWVSYIDVNKKRTILGYFKTIEEAVEARKRGEETYWKSSS